MKNKYVTKATYNFLIDISMTMGLITMFVGVPESVFSFKGLVLLTYHGFMFMTCFVMTATNYMEIEKGDLKYSLILFWALALIIWIFDAITKADYFFIYDGHNFGILYEISENVPHLVWTLIVMTCYTLTAVIIHFTVYGINALIKKQTINQKSN